MRDVDDCDANANQPSASPPLSTLACAFSAMMWSGLAGSVYILMPRFRKVFVEVGQDNTSLAYLVLTYFGFVFPVLMLAAVMVGFLTRRRWVKGFMALWLPLLTAVVLAVAVGSGILRMLNDLA